MNVIIPHFTQFQIGKYYGTRVDCIRWLNDLKSLKRLHKHKYGKVERLSITVWSEIKSKWVKLMKNQWQLQSLPHSSCTHPSISSLYSGHIRFSKIPHVDIVPKYKLNTHLHFFIFRFNNLWNRVPVSVVPLLFIQSSKSAVHRKRCRIFFFNRWKKLKVGRCG